MAKRGKQTEPVNNEAEEVVVAERPAATPSFQLPSRQVKLIPVIRNTDLPKGHEAEFLFGHATNRYGMRRHEFGGSYVNPLTKEEATAIENDPRMSLKPGDLSVHKTDNSFWKTSFKSIRVGKDGIKLDLSDPMDYIKYKVLLLYKDEIAPNADEMRRKASYKYAFVDEAYEDTKSASAANLLSDAFAEYSEMRNDASMLADVLFLITNQRASKDQSVEWLQGQVGDFLRKKPKKFLEVVKDPELQTKVLITKALSYGVIKREGTAFRTSAGDLIGNDLSMTIAFLNSDSNQDIRLIIEDRVAAAD